MRCGPILSVKVSVSVDTIFEDIICKRAFKVRPHLLPPAKVMFLHLSVILFTRGRGLCIEGGGSASKGGGQIPSPSDTTGYGQRTGGTHPTGMHSCSS